MKKCLRFPSMAQRHCPRHRFFGQPYLTCPPNQETDNLIQLPFRLTEGVDQSAHTPWVLPRRQKAPMALPAWEPPAFPWWRRRRNAHCMAHTSPGHSNSWMMHTHAPRPMGPSKARRLPKSAFTTLFQYLCTSDAAANHYDDKGWQRHTAKPNAIPSRDFPSIPTFWSRTQSRLWNVLPANPDVLQLHHWIITFHGPNSFHFLTPTRLSRTSCLTHFSVETIQLFLLCPIHSFVDCSTRSMPASTSDSTHLSLFQCDKCWCKLAVCRFPQLSNVNTSALNPDGRRKEILTEIRLPNMEKSHTSAQLANVNCTVVLNFDKTS